MKKFLSSYNHYLLPTSSNRPQVVHTQPNLKSRNVESWKFLQSSLSVSCTNQVAGGKGTRLQNEVLSGNFRKRVFLLDVNPLCYKGSTPSLESFVQWISRFFSEVSLTDPVIAVLDGECGNEYRRQLLPSYKANRRRSMHQSSVLKRFPKSVFRRSDKLVKDILLNCNIPIVKIKGFEADDVIATLVEDVLDRGYQVAIASPDKDFKQLISEDVQIVIPLPELNRWSFYTIKHYVAQHNCDPQSDLSLRCILGDEIDGVPGIQHLVPSFGRRTALKLLRKHGSLENLLNAAATRTVGKQYAQDALTKHADFLRRNYQVLSLKRDIGIPIEDQWFSERDVLNDSAVLANFLDDSGKKLEINHIS